jgi:hypothetical protein
MEAGPALDAKLASIFLGAFVVIEGDEYYMVALNKSRQRVKLPQYSTNTEDAYRLVKGLQAKGWFLRVVNEPQTNSFHVSFYKTTATEFVTAKTLPLAICMAALTTGDKLY